jgi:glycerophosphoryl diester phosphodiesterase
MKIISHRGFWLTPDEKNSETAFDRSFSLGFGIETDVRDSSQRLVISHDIPTGGEMPLASVLEKAAAAGVDKRLTLALNIKSDGLCRVLRESLDKFPELDCFVFDMATPDMRGYFESGIPVFTRLSEYESDPVWLELSAGVWLDAFDSEWYTLGDIDCLRKLNKRVCIVSPELHRRPYRALWERLKPLAGDSDMILCTDFPADATSFFSMNGDRK